MCGSSEDMLVHNFRLVAQRPTAFGDSCDTLNWSCRAHRLEYSEVCIPNKSEMETGKHNRREEQLTEHLKFKASNQRPLVILINVIGTGGKATGGEEERDGKGNANDISWRTSYSTVNKLYLHYAPKSMIFFRTDYRCLLTVRSVQ